MDRKEDKRTEGIKEKIERDEEGGGRREDRGGGGRKGRGGR